MQNIDQKHRQFAAAVMRTMMMVALFAAVLLFAQKTAFADDTVLTVQKDGVTVKEFSPDDLQNLAADEYTYSAWDDSPDIHEYKSISGPSVRAILDAAGVLADVGDKSTVTFTSDRTVCLTGKQLFTEERYYYPSANEVDHASGAVPESASDRKTEVPAIIGLSDSNGPLDGLLCIGQTGPGEENDELFITGLADASSPGIISISTSDAPKCGSVKVLDPKPGSICCSGTEVNLTEPEGGEKICYTFESSKSPGYGCPIYNYGTGLLCKPVLKGDWTGLILKTRTKCYGKQDGTLQTFSFAVGDALRVIVDGEIIKAYHLPEDITGKFETETYSYSGFNSNPSLSFRENEEGIRVDRIIEEATGKAANEFDGESTIRFTGYDGYHSVFTMKQLFGTERYYFPNAAAGTDNKGGKATADAYEDKQPVPVIIETNDVNKMLIGQSAPNDQNFPECVDHMLKLGTIEIVTAPAARCAAPLPLKASGSVVKPGTAIKFPLPSADNARNKLYYIIDPESGEIPGPGDAFYYYGAFHWPDEMINPPVLSKTGKHTIRIVCSAYGKQDSAAKTLTYYVTNPLGKPAVTLKAGSRRITVKWKRISGAGGYVVYRSTRKSTGFKAVKTVKSGRTVSFVNKSLKKGKRYYYKVRAYKTISGKKIYSSYSAVRFTKAK